MPGGSGRGGRRHRRRWGTAHALVRRRIAQRSQACLPVYGCRALSSQRPRGPGRAWGPGPLLSRRNASRLLHMLSSIFPAHRSYPWVYRATPPPFGLFICLVCIAQRARCPVVAALLPPGLPGRGTRRLRHLGPVGGQACHRAPHRRGDRGGRAPGGGLSAGGRRALGGRASASGGPLV